jgi:para-aminobenzoate synthetase component 1
MSSYACAHVLEPIDSPLSIFDYFSSFAHEEYVFFLESGRDPEKLGRYSFTSRRPFLIFKSKADRVTTIDAGGRVTETKGNAFVELRALMGRYRVDPALYRGSPLPFLGGAVGYFGYELGYLIEKLPCLGVDDLALPDCYFLFVDTVVIFDHLEQKMYLSAVGFDVDQATAEAKARRRLDEVRADLRRVEREGVRAPAPSGEPGGDDGNRPHLEFRAMFSEEGYKDVVKKSKEHIFAGDIFEVCTTHRLECDFRGDPFHLYRELRAINPAPFASYFNLPEVQIVSSSPERFLRLRRDGVCESRPIKGTRPRGKTPRQDRDLQKELMSSIKDRAENVMIVDLVRNDFGRVCQVGSVEVSELMIVEKYATVFQMVSTIVGRLEEGRDRFDLVQACFPGGSMTGAPKIEAMTIIDALEPVKRGIYSGSIGYLDYSGNMDLNIVIRTILVKDGKAYLQVGGAVVADSDPLEEYLETLTKARALMRALQRATHSAERFVEAPALMSTPV